VLRECREREGRGACVRADSCVCARARLCTHSYKDIGIYTRHTCERVGHLVAWSGVQYVYTI
jgi:hypothetical protein